jgi:DNA-binding NtrC family response regulator
MNKRILLVDDEDSIRETMSSLLKYKGFDIVEARDGLEAFELFKGESFDLIISDIRMPKCDGFELLKMVKKSNPNFPFFIITGCCEMSEADLIKNGASRVLLKPFLSKMLFDTIEECFSNKQPLSTTI